MHHISDSFSVVRDTPGSHCNVPICLWAARKCWGPVPSGWIKKRRGKMDEKVIYSKCRRSNTHVCSDECHEDKNFPAHLWRSLALLVARIPAPQNWLRKMSLRVFCFFFSWDSSLLKESEKQGNLEKSLRQVSSGLRQSLQVDRAASCSEERPCCLGRLH